MANDEYWEPPQTATRTTLLEDFDRQIDKRIIRTGKRIGNQTIGQAEATIRIEKLVNKILNTNLLPYQITYGPGGSVLCNETVVGVKLREAICMLGLFDSNHDYSEHLSAFLHSSWMMASVYGIDIKAVRRNGFEPDINYAEAMNDIVRKIRMHSCDNWFRRAASDRRFEVNTKKQVIENHTAAVLKHYASITNVRVDLSYLKEYRSKLTIGNFYAHLDHLLYQIDKNQLFEHLVGYAWHVEQGDERKGFHVHFAFMFNGSEMSNGVNMGRAIEHLWSSHITEGVGHTYICNANTHNYDQDKIGVGYGLRDDAKFCQNVISANSYLAKESQHLRIKPRGRRTFGVGVSPNLNETRGRPSLKPPTWHYQS